MKKFLDTRFKHGSWFKEGKTKRQALDYFKKSKDSYLTIKYDDKLARESHIISYVIILKMLGHQKSFYEMTAEEVLYFLS